MLPWVLYEFFNIYIPENVYLNTVIALLCLLWFIFLFSKIFFKKIFANSLWENLFIIMAGFPSVMQIYYGSLYYLNYLELGENFESYSRCFSFTFIDLDMDFLLPLFLFFIAYLTHFIIRLVHHMKTRVAIADVNE